MFGIGIGGLLTLLPIAWADYYGRRSYGAIRGIALSVQVLAQASGPLLSGILRDWSGSYELSLQCFVVLSGSQRSGGAAGASAVIRWRQSRTAASAARHAWYL